MKRYQSNAMFLLTTCLVWGGWTLPVHAEQFRIQTTPPRASLYINGSFRGQTPFQQELSSGRYHLEIRKKGFLTWTSYIEVPQRSDLSLRVRLEKRSGDDDPNTSSPGNSGQDGDRDAGSGKRGGLLIVNSQPSGVGVYSGGRFLGRTPLLKFLTIGTHSITLKQPGYRAHTATVRISSARSVRLSHKMEPGPGGGSANRGGDDSSDNGGQGESTQLMILSKPTARVYLNNRYMGQTPVLTAGIAPGVYRLTLKAKGYVSYNRTIQLHPGQQLRINASLVLQR